MVRISSTAALLIFVTISISSTEAFSPAFSNSRQTSSILAVPEVVDDDFDAPILADPVMSGKVGKLDHDPVVDDECYLGKNNAFDDCVDFGERTHTFE